MAYTCPRCGRTSRHPEDARQGYCGACRDWTGPGVPGEAASRFCQCETCGNRTEVPPGHVGRVWCPYGQEAESMRGLLAVALAAYRNGLLSLADLTLEVRGHLDQATVDLITGAQRNPVTDSGDHPGWPGQWDVAPYGDAMEWRPGDPEW